MTSIHGNVQPSTNQEIFCKEKKLMHSASWVCYVEKSWNAFELERGSSRVEKDVWRLRKYYYVLYVRELNENVQWKLIKIPFRKINVFSSTAVREKASHNNNNMNSQIISYEFFSLIAVVIFDAICVISRTQLG